MAGKGWVFGVLSAALIVSLGGCSGPRALGGDPNLRVLDASALPTPGREDITGGAQPYYVGPFDKLEIDTFGIQELGPREIQVDASGRISYPLAGVIDVSGQTPGEVERSIEERLRMAHVRDPHVTVNLRETVSRVVTVEGRVKKPGLYPVIGKLTLMRAVARAEGTDEFSDLEDVVIFRTVAGQRYAALYNLDAVRHGAYPDPEIFANDVVMVGDSSSRRLFRDVLMAMPALVTPLVIGLDRLTN